MVKNFEGKPAPATVTILTTNEDEVQRLCSGEYAARIAASNGLQPAWRGIIFALSSVAAGKKYESLANSIQDAKTKSALRDVSQLHLSNGLYRLRGVAKFLSDAAKVAQASPPLAVASPLSRFLSLFSTKVSSVASDMVARKVDSYTGETCNNYPEKDARRNCKVGQNGYEQWKWVGFIQWDFPLPVESRRSLTAKVEWPRTRVAPALGTPEWRKKYPSGKPGFDNEMFLNPKWEQMLNIVASVVVGSGKSIQDERFKPIRVAITQYDPSERSSIPSVDQGLAERLFLCFTHAWQEAGLGPWAPDGLSSFGSDESSRFPWRSSLAMLAGAGVVVALFLSSRRSP